MSDKNHPPRPADLPPGFDWPLDSSPTNPHSSEPYIPVTGWRPLGPTNWPEDWESRAVYGPAAFENEAGVSEILNSPDYTGIQISEDGTVQPMMTGISGKICVVTHVQRSPRNG